MHRRPATALLPVVALASLLGACGDDEMEAQDLTVAAQDLSGSRIDFSTTDAAGATLRVFNYLSWCTVSVNGGASNTDAMQVFTFPIDAKIDLVAAPASSAFEWGYWFGTDQDVSMVVHDTHMTTTVTLNTMNGHNATVGDFRVQACCPVAGSGMGCPVPQ